MNDLQIHVQDGEPRVLDTDLAEMLGMSRPRDIRADLIKANEAELSGYGSLRAAPAKSTGGRPAKAYYLNEEQALLVVMFSRTSKAAELRRQTFNIPHT